MPGRPRRRARRLVPRCLGKYVFDLSRISRRQRMKLYAFAERCAACLVQENGMHRIVGINQETARRWMLGSTSARSSRRLPLNSAVNRQAQPRHVPAGSGEAGDQAQRHGITDGDHNDGDIPSSRHGGNRRGVAAATMMSTLSRTRSAARPGGVRADHPPIAARARCSVPPRSRTAANPGGTLPIIDCRPPARKRTGIRDAELAAGPMQEATPPPQPRPIRGSRAV